MHIIYNNTQNKSFLLTFFFLSPGVSNYSYSGERNPRLPDNSLLWYRSQPLSSVKGKICKTFTKKKAWKQVMIALHKACISILWRGPCWIFTVAGESQLSFMPLLRGGGPVESFWCTSLIQFQYITLCSTNGWQGLLSIYLWAHLSYRWWMIHPFYLVSASLSKSQLLPQRCFSDRVMFWAQRPAENQTLSPALRGNAPLPPTGPNISQ